MKADSLLTVLVATPCLIALLCLLTPNPRAWERLNVAGAAMVTLLATVIATFVLEGGTLANAWFRADALSALVLVLTAFVSLVSTVYAVGYFRRDTAEARLRS